MAEPSGGRKQTRGDHLHVLHVTTQLRPNCETCLAGNNGQVYPSPFELQFQLTSILTAAAEYAEKLKDNTSGIICFIARCTRKKQPFDREKDGRVFTCENWPSENCKYKMCVDCFSPEHKNETCNAYRSRVSTDHDTEELASHEVLKNYKSCPSCNMPFTAEKCGYTQCICGYRFCSGCMTPGVGVGSAYLGGKAAHKEGCLYLTRDRPSKHGLKHRFQETDEVQARIEQKDLNNKRKREVKKAAISAKQEPQVDVKTESQRDIKAHITTEIEAKGNSHREAKKAKVSTKRQAEVNFKPGGEGGSSD